MSTKQSWLEAARRYQEASPTVRKQEDDALETQVIKELERFLSGFEGRAAMALLKASGRIVRIAEEGDGGRGTVYFLNGEGLRKSYEAMGLWVGYAASGTVPSPQVFSLDAKEAVKAARRTGVPLADLVNRIRRELDIIASQAPDLPSSS